jgi:DNA-binding MarR family transcriptional regulator
MTTRKKRTEVLNPVNDSLLVTSTTSGTDLPAASMSQQVAAARYDLRVLQALRQVIRAVDLHSRQLLTQHKITGPQLITMLTVKSYEPVTVSAIAGHIHLSPSTVIGILDRLEAKGLIRRDRDLKDRRLMWISLTEQGKVLANNAPSPLQDTLAEALVKLPETELVMIVESLERIVRFMQMHHVDTAPTQEAGLNDPDMEKTMHEEDTNSLGGKLL